MGVVTGFLVDCATHSNNGGVGLEEVLQGDRSWQSKVARLERMLQGHGDELGALRKLARGTMMPDGLPSARELHAELKYDLHQDVDARRQLRKIAAEHEAEALARRVDGLSEKLAQLQDAILEDALSRKAASRPSMAA